MRYNSHVASLFHWSRNSEVTFAEMAGSGLAMLLPAACLTGLGHPGHGMAAALGGMAVSGTIAANSTAERLRVLAMRLYAVAAATAAAVLIAALHSLAPIGLIACVLAAAVIGGYSRPFAEASTRFILFLVIVAGIMAAGSADTAFRLAVGGLVLSGALIGMLLMMLPGLLRRQLQPETPPLAGGMQRTPTPAQKRAHLKRSLQQLSGWQYPIRLGGCLAIAAIAEWLWPGHHLHWIAVTIAVLLRRQPNPSAVKATQRAMGAMVGVTLTGMLLSLHPNAWLIVIVIGMIAALRPLLLARNYLAYSAVMTPLIMLIFDSGGHFDTWLLADRLIATAVGTLLAIAADRAAVRLLTEAEPAAQRR